MTAKTSPPNTAPPIKSVLRYPGAKWALSKWVVENLPTHEVYLEPFFGSGAVFFAKPPSRTETINDLDGNVVNLFKVMREQTEALCNALSLTPWARAEYLNSYADASSTNEVERARLFLVRCWQAFGTRTGQASGWRNRTCGKNPTEPDIWKVLPERVTSAARRLRDAQIESMDAIALIKRYAKPNCLIYADPPYTPDSRSKNIYAFECDDQFHRNLLDALDNHPGPVVLSGYDNPLYDERLAHWRKVTKEAVAELGHKRLEVLWIKDVIVPVELCA